MASHTLFVDYLVCSAPVRANKPCLRVQIFNNLIQFNRRRKTLTNPRTIASLCSPPCAGDTRPLRAHHDRLSVLPFFLSFPVRFPTAAMGDRQQIKCRRPPQPCRVAAAAPTSSEAAGSPTSSAAQTTYPSPPSSPCADYSSPPPRPPRAVVLAPGCDAAALPRRALLLAGSLRWGCGVLAPGVARG